MGCGASLAIRSKDELLNAAYDAGINVFDVGYSGYYHNAQENLSSFIRGVRDKVFLISKAPAELDSDVAPNQSVTVDQAKRAAKPRQQAKRAQTTKTANKTSPEGKQSELPSPKNKLTKPNPRASKASPNLRDPPGCPEGPVRRRAGKAQEGRRTAVRRRRSNAASADASPAPL